MDHRKRISIDQLAASSWLLQSSYITHFPTLMTSTLLLADPSTEQCIKQTYDAFHNATRDGFRLIPVNNSASGSSKLLQKRKLKQSTSTETISSTSDRSSLGSKSSSSCSSMNLASNSAKLWSSGVHNNSSGGVGAATAATSSTAKLKDGDVFCFKPSQVTDFLFHGRGLH